MRNARLLPVLLVLTCICGVGWTQVAGPQVMPPVESVLNHIPAGAMGFFVVNGIDDLLVKVETFYQRIGSPVGGLPPLGDLIRSSMGPDFNINGDFAAVMLDPALFDVDLVELLTASFAPATTQPGPQALVDEDAQVPYLFIVAGLSTEGIMSPVFEVTQEGDYTVLTNSQADQSFYAVKVGGYILLSPSLEVLEAVRSADSSFEDEVSADQYQAIAEADFAAYANMSVSAPVLIDLLEAVQSGNFGPMSPMTMGQGVGAYSVSRLMLANLANLNEQLDQIESVSLQYTFTETGLRFQESVVFDEDSPTGQFYMSMPAVEQLPIDMLPNLPYVIAGGCRAEMNEQMRQQSLDTLSNMLNTPEIQQHFSEEVIARMLSIAEEMYTDVSEVQFVVGGAPAGAGTIAAAFVFRTADPEGAMARLPEDLPLLETALNTLITQFDGEAGLTITVFEDVETIAGVSVDKVVLSHPDLADASSDEFQEMQAVLGTTEVMFLVAAPDENTLVVTFGGGSAMMAETIEAAMNGGSIAASAGVAEVMAELPDDPYMVMLVSLGNLGQVGVATEQAVDPDSAYIAWPFQYMETTAPIALGASVDGATVHVTVFAPNEVIADAVASVSAAQADEYDRLREQMGGQQGPMEPMLPGTGPVPVEPPEPPEPPAEPYDPGF